MTPNAFLIVKQLEEAADAYYNTDTPQLTDGEFDALEQELRRIDPSNPYFETIGSDVRGGKVKLPYPMGSLDQVYENETAKWVSDNGWLNETFIVSNKLDGTSGLHIHGKRGNLLQAFSRGNGVMGADITRHVKNFESLSSSVTEECVVRVEYIMAEEHFEMIMSETSGRIYKNSRNYTAGRMNASDGDPEFYKYIQCVATSLVHPVMSKADQFIFLKKMGYRVAYYMPWVGNGLNDKSLTDHLNEQRKISEFAIDGLVVDLNDHKLREKLYRKSSSLNPMFAKKYKVGAAANMATTEVVGVEWSASKSGYLKPRIQVKPVNLVGVTIQYATGFNAKFIRDNGIGPGAQVNIVRSGDVIPFITEVVKSVTPSLPLVDDFGAMYWSDNEVDLILKDNTEEGEIAKLVAAFTALEVDNLKEGSIVKLWGYGYTNVQDIIKLPEAELVRIIGENGKKIYTSLQHRLNPITKANLAGSVQIFPRGLGRRKFRKLFDKYPNANFEDFTLDMVKQAEGFSDITAENVMAGMLSFLVFLGDIDGYYTFDEGVKKVNPNAKMTGETVCFTGVRDKELEKFIEDLDGTIGSSVSSKTTILVAKDPESTSGKAQKARDMGIRVVGLQEMWDEVQA